MKKFMLTMAAVLAMTSAFAVANVAVAHNMPTCECDPATGCVCG